MRSARRARWLTLVGVLLLAGCGGGGGSGQGGESADQPPEEPVRIRMGWLPTASGAEQDSLMVTNPDLAPNRGTWYELEFAEFPGTPQVLQGLAAGSLDAGTLGSLTVANGLDQGADLVITGQYIQERPGWGETVWLVRKGSGIRSGADVSGRTVAVNQVGAYVDYVADAWFRQNGRLEADRDYKKVEIPFPQMQEAVASGQADVGVFPAVFATRAMASGQFERLFGATDVQEQLIITVQAFRREFVEEHPVTVRKFLEDFVTLSRYVAEPENRKVVVESFSETSEVPIEQADNFLLTRKDYFRPPDGVVDVALLQRNWDFFREQGAFESRLEAEDAIMPELRPE